MWITDYRERWGLDIGQLGAMIRHAGRKLDPPLWVSDGLLHRFEVDPNFRTVPKLANLIAETLGATAKQRDELVLEKYRGTWKPRRGRKKNPALRSGAPCSGPKGLAALRDYQAPPQPSPSRTNPFPPSREVVRVNRDGVITGRYRSCNNAAVQNGVTENQVTRRCHKRYVCDEFKQFGFSFRFADEWDAMGPGERWEDVHQRDGVKGHRGGGHGAKLMTVIHPNGEMRLYESLREAAMATGISADVIYQYMHRAKAVYPPVVRLKGYCYMYAYTWDALTEEQRAQIRRAADELG